MVPDSALAACQILLYNTKKPDLSLGLRLQCASCPVCPCMPLCTSMLGVAFLLLPAGSGRIWAAVPPFRSNAFSGHVMPPNRFARDEKKSKKNKIATSPRSADCCPCPSAATGWRDVFTHLRVGQAERLACRKRPPNAFLRAEARTHFFCPTGPIDNFLITLPVWYGYPQKFLVCCRSRRGSGSIPNFYAEVMKHGSPNQKPGDRLPGHSGRGKEDPGEGAPVRPELAGVPAPGRAGATDPYDPRTQTHPDGAARLGKKPKPAHCPGSHRSYPDGVPERTDGGTG